MIRGYCIGGGLLTAMKTDIRIAAEGSQFGVPAAKLGLGYAYGGVEELMALVGPAWAAEILFSARRLEADEALRIGLVNRVVPVDELEATVRELAATIAAQRAADREGVQGGDPRGAARAVGPRPRRGRAHGRGLLPLRGLPRGPGRVRREAGTAVPGPVMPTRAERALQKVRTICAALPEVEERPSHGAPTFFYRGKKTFVMFHDDHHGDGRLAIWCHAPDGVQHLLVTEEPERFFVPAYVGHRGWVGVRLDVDVDWDEVAGIVRDAYRMVVPPKVAAAVDDGGD